MRILQIIQRSQLRGAEIFACQLSVALQQMGHQVDVLILFGEQNNVLNYPLYFIHLKANEQKRWVDFKAYRSLANLIQKGQYDLVQANAGDTLKYAALSKKIFGWKASLVFRNANKISDFINGNVKRQINKWLMKELDGVASVSEDCKQDFACTFNFPLHKMANLPISVSGIASQDDSNNKEIVLEGTGPFLLQVASFVPEKNHSGMVRMFAQLIKDYPNAKLFLIGQGKLKSNIQQQVANAGLQDGIVFLGARHDVYAWMKACSVLVLPSLIEGLPGVILEAFVNKLPVVAYNVGGIKEVLLHEQTGWLVNKNDESNFLHCVKQALSMPNPSIKQQAHQLASDEYSSQQIAVRFELFFKDVVA